MVIMTRTDPSVDGIRVAVSTVIFSLRRGAGGRLEVTAVAEGPEAG